MKKYSPPLILQRADPCILLGEDGFYYFTASVPEFDRIELRRAETVEGLAHAQPAVIWRKHESGPMSRYIWAPEIHRIGGEWVVYFAATGHEPDGNGVFDHRIFALSNSSENPMEGSFMERGQIDTGMESFCLDASSFTCGGKRYFVWATATCILPKCCPRRSSGFPPCCCPSLNLTGNARVFWSTRGRPCSGTAAGCT